MDIVNGQLGEKCLKSSKSASLQCRLHSFEAMQSLTNSEYISNRLSSLKISNTSSDGKCVPESNKMYSFLLKNETKFLDPITATIEEFNAILSNFDPHMTVILSWTALVIDGSNSTKRTAYGQHFIQLRNLYEKISCPETTESRIRNYLSDASDFQSIFNLENRAYPKENIDFEGSDDDDWEVNKMVVSRRCILEDETFIVGHKVY